jgi:predicted ATPase
MSAFRIMPSDYDYSKTELYRKRDELVKALISIGIDAVDARKELDPFFDKVIDLGKRLNKLSESNERLNDGDTVFELMLNRANVTRLESLVKAVRDYNQRGASLSHRFDAFVSCVNEFFVDSRKEIEIDPVGILRIKRPDRVEIPIEALSSGERQLLIMLGHLYFNSFGDKSNVFIIDEPELSLHLRWQEMLLHKMLESNPRAQVVVATHSPEVVGEFSNHCVGI